MESKILAVVNGKKISEIELERIIERFPQEKKDYFRTEEGNKQLLEQLIAVELVYNYAKDTEMEKNEAYLTEVEDAKKDILNALVINSLFSQVDVTDQDALEYYSENSETFGGEETVSASHILVDSYEKAADIKAKIDAGLAFEEAALEYSNCPSKSSGGNLGSFTRGRMVPEFESAAFSLPIGVLSDPVQTNFGFHLIVVNEKTSNKAKSYDEVKDAIKKNLLREKQTKKYTDLVEELNGKYDVQRF
jgi:peptidyl-prolyl cis-trans isomerase C